MRPAVQCMYNSRRQIIQEQQVAIWLVLLTTESRKKFRPPPPATLEEYLRNVRRGIRLLSTIFLIVRKLRVLCTHYSTFSGMVLHGGSAAFYRYSKLIEQ